MTLASYDISPSEALLLLDYEDFEWFAEEFVEQSKRKKIQKQLELAEAILYGVAGSKSKEGLQSYQKWRKDKADDMKPKEKKTIWGVFEEDKPQKTVWDMFIEEK